MAASVSFSSVDRGMQPLVSNIINKEFNSDGTQAVYVFDKQTHIKTLAANLDCMRQSDHLLDLVLVGSDDKSHKFPSVLLASTSDTFQALLSEHPKMQFCQSTIQFEEHSSDVVKALQDYLYRPGEFFDVPVWTKIMDFAVEMGVHKMVDGSANMEEWLQRLNHMLTNKKLTFILLQGGDGGDSVFTHGSIMAASSQVILQHLLNMNVSSSGGRTHVQLRTVHTTDIESLAEYIYTAELKIHLDSVRSLTLAANQLGYPAVSIACFDFISNTVRPKSALGLLQLVREIRKLASADEPSCRALEHKLISFIVDNLSEILKCEEFQRYPTESDIIEYLCRGNRDSLSLEVVLEPMLSWRTAGQDRDRAFVRVMSIACKMFDAEALHQDEDICRKFGVNHYC